MRIAATLVLLGLIAMTSDVSAAVLCAAMRGDGTFSTTVKIREGCRPNETKLVPAAVGIGSNGVVIRDANHALVGVVANIRDTDQGPTPGTVLRQIGAVAVPISFDSAGNIFGGSRSEMWFADPGCDGVGYVPEYTSLRPESVKVGNLLFYGNGGAPASVVVQSHRTVGPVLPDACEDIAPTSMSLVRAAVEDLSVLVPPFRLEIE